MSKGLDSAFIHYGTRREDLKILEKLAEKHGLDWDWIQELILKQYHEKKTQDDLSEERNVVKIIENAVAKLEID